MPDPVPKDAMVVRVDGREVACVPPSPAGLALVEQLVRMQLQARRSGERLTLGAVSEELRGLLELVGLADVLGVEPRGQPELREERREDEVVQARDRAV